MRQHGFTVTVTDVDDIVLTRRAQGVPDHLGACHTATVAGYLVGGHVPVEDVRRLLAERPAATGIFVAGIPKGTPGMEGGPEPYDLIALDKAGQENVFSRHVPSANSSEKD
jgi:hypothetical protein